MHVEHAEQAGATTAVCTIGATSTGRSTVVGVAQLEQPLENTVLATGTLVTGMNEVCITGACSGANGVNTGRLTVTAEAPHVGPQVAAGA